MVTFLRPQASACSNANCSRRRLPWRVLTPGGHRDRVRIVVDLDVVFVADVQPLEVLAHYDEVDVVEASARDERAGGAQIRVQLEFLAQADVRRPIAAARRRLERPLQGQTRAANAVDGRLRQRILRRLHALHAGGLPIPLERRPQRIERGKRGVDDLGSDPVSGDQRGGNGLRHRRAHGVGVRLAY